MDDDTSTPSSEGFQAEADYDDDNMFPGASGGPQTPQNDHLDATAAGELSPPRSQDPNRSKQVAATTNGSTVTNSRNEGNTNGGSAVEDAQGEERPGAGWKNKKAQEEAQRAWDFIVDRDFNVREFGDVILQGKAQRGS